jgi:cytochrome c peroxidase
MKNINGHIWTSKYYLLKIGIFTNQLQRHFLTTSSKTEPLTLNCKIEVRLMKLIPGRFITVFIIIGSFIWLSSHSNVGSYADLYKSSISDFIRMQKKLYQDLPIGLMNSSLEKEKLKRQIANNRIQLKKIDFWLRYLDPGAYKRINGPLPVEWETEVFEKFEKPYKREGAGLTLAELYLEEENFSRDSFAILISKSIEAAQIYFHDSITRDLRSHDHFFLANRLFLLNLATIYTTGFECPDTKNIIPELKGMIKEVYQIYAVFNKSFPDYQVKPDYLKLYSEMMVYVEKESEHPEQFNHFLFIRDYVNPLFAINQSYLRLYKAITTNFNDYSLNDYAVSIYDKQLYTGQDVKGVYRSIKDSSTLEEIMDLGKLLFYDPILSGNNKRSCVSCHKPKEFFTDTSIATPLQFDHTNRLDRNAPSLINVGFNHLIMLDGKHINLFNQAKDVMSNKIELHNLEEELVDKVMSCPDYKNKLKKFAAQSTDKKISLRHINAAMIMYYTKFSYFYSPFDNAMNRKENLDATSIKGFNIFMSKAQCATCHFAPQFNGVKPPYIGSEFEVIGVPETNEYKKLSPDKGRYLINPAKETMHAFRTGTIRNAFHTKPYMHNGALKTLEEVIDLYDSGGGAGKGLIVDNQTLSSDSLRLNDFEKQALMKFIESLTEDIPFEDPPMSLPKSSKKKLNTRVVGGEY